MCDVAAPTLRRSRSFVLLTLMLALGSVSGLWAGDVYWTGGANHGPNPSYWTTAGNWNTLAVPTSADNAILAAEATTGSTNAYFDFANNSTPCSVGCITLSAELSGHNAILRQQAGKLPVCVYGVNGVLVTNASLRQLQIAQNSPYAPVLYLAGSGAIGAVSNILVYAPIGETNGSYGFTKTGAGYLILQTLSANTHTGPTTISEGVVDLRLATSAFGPGTLYLGNGTLLCSADRSAVAPTASPVVVTGDAAIKGNGSLANSSRIFPFSGTFGGSSGSLTIDNIGAANNTFIVRLIGGGFNFTRPITLNSLTSTYGSYAMLQLSNAPANGDQTFSGVISSIDNGGKVDRMGADGTTIFTAANTYQGGTSISRGTLLANNTTGSALGSGAVTVTNLGILGGNGAIVASTTVTRGGTVAPGAAVNTIANLNISDLVLDQGAVYQWQIAAATGTAGTAWDLITISSSWWESATSGNPITIKVDSRGVTPTGWSPGTARDWVILQSSYNPGFNANDWALDTTAFAGPVSGIFSLYVDSGGSLHLTYTPAADIVINVASGTKTQTEAGYGTLTGSQGVAKVGNGELVLDNSYNDYLGSTKVLAGMLSISVDAANGSGALGNSSTATYLGNTTGNSNATFNINVSGVTMSHDIVVQAGSSGTKTIGTTLSSGTATYLGDIALQDSAILSAAAGSSVTFGGNFSGNGGVTLNGPGSFELDGTGAYAGTTTVNTPVLTFKGPAFGTNTITFATAMTLDNTSGADVVLNSAPQNWNADFEFLGSAGLYLGSGPVTMSGSRNVTVDAGTLVVGGPIGGNGGLTKRGAGALSLTATTASTYTGGTTNLQGVLVVNDTATLGDGTGALVLGGGNLLCTASHTAAPLANPVVMTTDTVITCTNQTGPTYLAFSGRFSAPSGNKLTIANKGWNTTVSGVRLQGPGNIDWPIVVGDPVYDRPAGGVTNQLQFYSDTNTPAQIVSGVISGPGWVVRGNVSPNTGGTTIFTAQNTFTGPANLWGGAIGFGCDTISSSGVITSGPVGTDTLVIGNQTTTETNMTVFAYGGPRIIENPIFLNGAQNVNMTGTNDLTFTGAINAGGIAKTWTVRDGGRLTLSGQITSNAGSDGAPLTKAGPGTLILSGDNLYTGATTIAAGTLLANNTSGSATGPNNITVRSGATLGGTGTVAGRVTVTSGNIAPGASAGTLTVGGGVNLSSGGTYVWELAANSTNGPGSNFDVLAVTGGNVVLDGTCQLAINFIGSATAPDANNPFWQTNHSWTILTVTSPASNPGPTAFPTIVNGTNSAGAFWDYADAGGNIVLVFTPGVVQPPPRPTVSNSIVGAGTPNPTLSWSSVNNAHYELQYKTNLNQAGWLVVGDVVANSTTTSMTHTNCYWPQCYYRVIAY